MVSPVMFFCPTMTIWLNAVNPVKLSFNHELLPFRFDCQKVVALLSLALLATFPAFVEEAEAVALKERFVPAEPGGILLSTTLLLATGLISSGMYPSEVIVQLLPPDNEEVTE